MKAPPAPFEDALRRFIVRRLALVTAFAGREFERQDCSAAAFVRALTVFFVSHEEFQGSQNEGPKPALFPVGAIEISPFSTRVKNSCVRSCARSAG